MKRYILTTIGLFIFSFILFGQQIENPGFEDWEEVGLGPEILEPVNWSTIKTSDNPALSGQAPVTWERITEFESHSGQYAVKFTNTSILGIPVVGTMCNGRYHPHLNTELAYAYTVPEDPQWNTPFTSRPDSIAFWMKFFPVDDDTLQFQALLHVGACSLPPNFINPENQVGYTRADLGGTYEEWTRISLAFEYFDNRTPEYLLMIITSGNGTNSNIGSVAYYDDLEIIESQSINANPLSKTNIFISKGNLMLQNFPAEYLFDANIEVLDLTGRQIWQSQINSSEIPLNTSNIQKGLYIVRINTNDYSFSNKLYID